MDLFQIEQLYNGKYFDNFPNESLVDNFEEWFYHSSIPISGLISIGWMSSDNILMISVDGIFIYDINIKKVVYEDFESSFKKELSSDNLFYNWKESGELVSMFGLRGGGGNLLTRNGKWKIELLNIAWNVSVPKIENYSMRDYRFLILSQNSYEGKKFIGFSKSESYFAIMGDGGVDIYSCSP